MMDKEDSFPAGADAWHTLKQFTPARIALGHAGISLPTRASLEFQLAHALARDAVSIPLDFVLLEQVLTSLGYKTLTLHSQADSHKDYLQRPDKGRLLNPGAVACLQQAARHNLPPDIAVIVADGLSSRAIASHAVPFLKLLLPQLDEHGYALTPICLVKHGRVAIGDPISELFSARMSIVLIGERPGLSSPDSMGVYFTYQAKTGSTDAERNCISNIHKNGLRYEQAQKKLLYLIQEADRLQLSGIHLKDETTASSDTQEKPGNFLLE